MIEKKSKGAWIIHHTHKIQNMTDQNSYGKIYAAGRSGLLLSALSERKQSDLDNETVQSIATGVGINELELDGILARLERHRLIARGSAGISVLGLTTSAVLDHIADLYDALQPRPREDAALEV